MITQPARAMKLKLSVSGGGTRLDFGAVKATHPEIYGGRKNTRGLHANIPLP